MQTPEHLIVLVTGATKGIGRQVAEQFAARGMTVIIGSRVTPAGEGVAAPLRAAGREALALPIDVTDPDTIAAAHDVIAARYGRLDVLINNAGISGALLAPSNADLDDVRAVFETNVFGVISVTNAMLPLLARSSAPRIVNLSSSVGSLTAMSAPDGQFDGIPASAAYPASKTALNALTVQYAKELRGSNFLVNSADPGRCATDLIKGLEVQAPRSAADGAAIVVHLATLGPDGLTGGFFNDSGPVAW